MLPYLSGNYGNASSVHGFGRDAKVALESSREQVAALIGCEPAEFFFTSGGTESDNLAVFGTALHRKSRKNHLVVGATEHHAVLEPAENLAHKHEFTLDLLPVDVEGFANPQQLASLVRDNTSLVSVMHANNETGTIQDVAALAHVAKNAGALFHTDAIQTVGKIPVNVRDLGVDLLSLTAHKIYGPKGIGGLFVRQGVKLAPMFYGGTHEKRRRPGTENVAGAVGLAKALELAHARMDDDYRRLTELADMFVDGTLNRIPHVVLNGPRDRRIPQTVNLSFKGVEGESIVLSLDIEGIACSSGSACTSGATEPSHVLTAMGKPSIEAQGAVRFSLGHGTTAEQIEVVLEKLPAIIDRLRDLSPMYSRTQ